MIGGHNCPESVRELVGLGLRRNPARPYLLVSRVLGKHVPADPRVVLDAGRRLGAAVAATLGPRPAVVIGYAETATALGHVVADHLGAPYLHSTRRTTRGLEPLVRFEERHSHAVRHLLVPADPRLLTGPEAVVLVDDELSTGQTAANTIRALHALAPHPRHLVAALVDVRAAADVDRMAGLAAELGARVEVTSLARGRADLSAEAAELAAGLAAGPATRRTGSRAAGSRPAPVERVDAPWPAGLPEGGRHGCPPATGARMRAAAGALAARLAGRVAGPRVLVLGCEELMYAPLLIACALADRLTGRASVRFSSTTRSPVVVADEPGYPIRTALTFAAHEPGAEGERFAYNVAPAAGAEPFTDVVLVVDEVADTPALWAEGGLVDQLARLTERVSVVTLPTHRPVPDA